MLSAVTSDEVSYNAAAKSLGICNVVARLGGEARLPAIAIGSHLDTMPNGGAFDGSIGVLAGLEIARRVRDRGDGWSTPLEVIAFRDEEGRFGALTGSRAMMGLLPADAMGRLRAVDGTGLAEAMRGAGLDPEAALQARRDPAELAAFLELHRCSTSIRRCRNAVSSPPRMPLAARP